MGLLDTVEKYGNIKIIDTGIKNLPQPIFKCQNCKKKFTSLRIIKNHKCQEVKDGEKAITLKRKNKRTILKRQEV